MKLKRVGIALIFLFFISTITFAQKAFKYTIDLQSNLDTFKVKLDILEKLKKKNSVFQFPATAPGTYQTMNIGRFVSDFKAYDKNNHPIETTFIPPNQYKIKRPRKLKQLTYKVAETFDTPVNELPIYLMAGSSIQPDHVLFNAQTCTGFFKGKQNSSVEVKFNTKEDWLTATAMTKNNDGYLLAENFDQLVDSPVLMGKMSMAETTLGNTPIKVYVYSEQGYIKADTLMKKMTLMLNSAEKYLIHLPVDHYTFMFYFLQNTKGGVTGAWEHSFSSEYVLQEEKPNDRFYQSVVDMASHEFFHIVTPLNLHSEIIEHFNFEKPTPSQHLWLYEGVTEWASHIQLYRGGVTDLKTYIKNGLVQKILVNELYFKPDWSLLKIAEESFNGGEGAQQYGNIYYKGSIVASYLDIKLLELSNGKSGLRELIQILVSKYGKGIPFNEATFFDEIANLTSPEIKDFITKYIKGNEPLPHEAFLSKIGLKFERTDNNKIVIYKMANPSQSQENLFNAWSKNL